MMDDSNKAAGSIELRKSKFHNKGLIISHCNDFWDVKPNTIHANVLHFTSRTLLKCEMMSDERQFEKFVNSRRGSCGTAICCPPLRPY